MDGWWNLSSSWMGHRSMRRIRRKGEMLTHTMIPYLAGAESLANRKSPIV